MTENKRPLAPEDLLDYKLAGGLALSPDGSRLVFVQKEADREENGYRTRLYSMAPGSGGAPLPYTGGEHDSAPAFSPDGQYLAFIRKAAEGAPNLWVLPTAGGEARQLTKLKNGVGSFAWAPDSRRIAFITDIGDEGMLPDGKDEEKDLFKKHTTGVKVTDRLFNRLDGVGYYRDRYDQICSIDLADPAAPPGEWKLAGPAAAGEPRQLTSGPYMHDGISFSPDGRSIATVTSRNPKWQWHLDCSDVVLIPTDGGEPRLLTNFDHGCMAAAFSPDGSLVAFLAAPAEGFFSWDNARVYVVPAGEAPAGPAGLTIPAVAGPAGEGRRAARCLTAGLDRFCGNAAALDMPAPGGLPLRWAPDGRSLLVLVSEEGMVHLWRVPLTGGEPQRLTGGDRVVYDFALSGDARYLAFAAAGPLDPGEIYAGSLGPQGLSEERRLTALHDALQAKVALVAPERFRYRSPDGHECDGWLIRPVGAEPGRRYPALLEIHGGPTAMYSSAFFFEMQHLAGLGFAIVYTNPRGSQGYGAAHCGAIKRDWGNKDYMDVIAGLDAAIARFDCIDPDRLGVLGGSYGGYMTNWIIGHTDRFKGAVSMRCVSNFLTMAGTSDGGWQMADEWQEKPWGLGEKLWEQSPIKYVEKMTTPVLIEHQEGDLRCHIEQGLQLYQTLKYLGRTVKLVTYPDEFHGMSRDGKPWHRVHRLISNSDWMLEHVAGRKREESGPLPERGLPHA